MGSPLPGLLALLTALPLTAVADDDAFPAATPESQGMDPTAIRALVEVVDRYSAQDLFVGAELSIIKNRRTVLHQVWGDADRETGEPWSDETIVNIRSMTKPLTGAAAQILIDRGLLGLDEPVSTYLEGFDNERSREITVRQLLTHRAGLPLTILKSIDEFETLLDMGDAVGDRGPEFEPGSRFWYTDAGTDALGAVVEAASGQRIDEFIHTELLEPLGMEDSFYDVDPDDPRRSRIGSIHMGAAGHWNRFADPAEKAFYPFPWGSQSLYSTPEDYAKFLAMWMDGGVANEHPILSPAAIERTLTPVSEMTMMGSDARFPTSLSGLEVWYGQMAVLYVPVGSGGSAPAQVVGHSGSDGTIAWAWPERDLMILFFTQSRGGSAVLRLEAAIDRLLISPESWVETEPVPKEVEPYIGTYIADWATHMKEEFAVRWELGHLVLDVPTQMEFQLEAAEENERWHFAIEPNITVWFEHDNQGVVDCLRIKQGQLAFEAPRKGTPREARVAQSNLPDPKQLAPLLGRYDDPETGEVLTVSIDGDYVAIQRAEGPTFHLWKVPVADVWQVRENPAVSITFQVENGRSVSMTRHAATGAPLVMPRTPDALDPTTQRLEGDDEAEAAVRAVLADLHRARAEGEVERYFSHFEPTAVILGTARGERASRDEYREWAADVYPEARPPEGHVRQRHVTVDTDGHVAWFDELIDRPELPLMRVTGVLRLDAGTWRVAFLARALLIPNALAREFQAMVTALPRGGQPAFTSAGLGSDRHAEAGSIDATLDAWQRSRVGGGFAAYAEQYANNVVTFGTAPEERYSRDEMIALMAPHHPLAPATFTDRSIMVDETGDEAPRFAWFDETMHRDGLAPMRVTGVLRREDDQWRFVQHEVSFHVPNELVGTLTEKTRGSRSP